MFQSLISSQSKSSIFEELPPKRLKNCSNMKKSAQLISPLSKPKVFQDIESSEDDHIITIGSPQGQIPPIEHLTTKKRKTHTKNQSLIFQPAAAGVAAASGAKHQRRNTELLQAEAFSTASKTYSQQSLPKVTKKKRTHILRQTNKVSSHSKQMQSEDEHQAPLIKSINSNLKSTMKRAELTSNSMHSPILKVKGDDDHFKPERIPEERE